VPGHSRQEDVLDFTGIQVSPYKIGIVSFRHSAILLLRCLPGTRSCILLRQPSAASMCLKRPSMLLGGAANILLLKLCAVCCQHIDSRVGVHHPLHRACMTRVFIHVQRRLQAKDALITAVQFACVEQGTLPTDGAALLLSTLSHFMLQPRPAKVICATHCLEVSHPELLPRCVGWSCASIEISGRGNKYWLIKLSTHVACDLPMNCLTIHDSGAPNL
jgi:hypothetical protein